MTFPLQPGHRQVHAVQLCSAGIVLAWRRIVTSAAFGSEHRSVGIAQLIRRSTTVAAGLADLFCDYPSTLVMYK